MTFIEELTRIANAPNSSEDPYFMVDDYTGCNIDDAYELGRLHGEIEMAKWVLSQLEVKDETN